MSAKNLSSLRTAVIGVGYLGRFHAQKHKTLGTLKFICDASAERAVERGKELGVESTSSYESLLGKVDAVTIAADTTSHYKVAEFFLKNGVHTLVEKPITVKVEEGEKLVALARKNSLVLQVGHIERFNPVFVHGQKLIQKPRYVELQRLAPFKTRSLSVDVILDLMIHDIDLARAYTKAKLKDFSAAGVRIFSDYNDWAQAHLYFEDGFHANMIVSRADSQSVRKITVVDQDRVLTLDLGGTSIQIAEKSDDPAQPLKLGTVTVDKFDALLAETESFFNSIVSGAPVQVTGEDGLEALRIAELVMKKIKG
ncbi:MAG: Gfo/Idh/MocA family protein [Bdellovibrionales bacterium]